VRAPTKRAVRNADIVMLQETRSDRSNEIKRGLWWEGSIDSVMGQIQVLVSLLYFQKCLYNYGWRLELY